jgi:hypothetical protein
MLEAFELDGGLPEPIATTIGDVVESIETNLWLSEAYIAREAHGLADECLRAAFAEYWRFSAWVDIFQPGLGDKVKRLAVERGVV